MDRLVIAYELAQRIRQAAQKFRKVATPSEAILWQALRRRQLDGRKFRRQHPIASFVVDFVCIQQMLIVEVDGAIHADQLEADQERQALLESLGYRVLRLSADIVERDLAAALAAIRAMWLDR